MHFISKATFYVQKFLEDFKTGLLKIYVLCSTTSITTFLSPALLPECNSKMLGIGLGVRLFLLSRWQRILNMVLVYYTQGNVCGIKYTCTCDYQ